jgi:hypothetical protein
VLYGASGLHSSPAGMLMLGMVLRRIPAHHARFQGCRAVGLQPAADGSVLIVCVTLLFTL